MKNLFKHLKTQAIYELIEDGRLESTRERVVIYRRFLTGETWVRPAAEFYDGRFLKLNPEQTQAVMDHAAIVDSIRIYEKKLSEQVAELTEAEEDGMHRTLASLYATHGLLQQRIANF